MYVSIDMDKLVFTHKHPDHEVVSQLSWLECGTQRSIVITATDKARFFKKLSVLDMKLLYKNTTGGTLAGEDPVAIRYQLSTVAELLPPTRAVREEVLEQVALVEDRLHAGETFKYVFGARSPAQPQELFPLSFRPLSGQELDNAAEWAKSALPEMTTGAPRGPWPARMIDETLVPAPSVPAPAAPAAPAADVSTSVKKQKRPNAKVEIWAVADEAWKAAGSPTQPEQLKALWVSLLPELTEKRGLHPTTCRIKLAEWARERASQ